MIIIICCASLSLLCRVYLCLRVLAKVREIQNNVGQLLHMLLFKLQDDIDKCVWMLILSIYIQCVPFEQTSNIAELYCLSYFYSVNEKRRRTSRVCSNYCMLLYGHNVYQYLISFYMQSGCNILCVLIYYSRVCSIMKLKHSRSQSHLMVNNRKYKAQGGWGWMGIPLVYLYP